MLAQPPTPYQREHGSIPRIMPTQRPMITVARSNVEHEIAAHPVLENAIEPA